MTTICNWNLHHLFPKILKIRGYDGQISHGICGQCAAQILKNLEQKTEKKRNKRRNKYNSYVSELGKHRDFFSFKGLKNTVLQSKRVISLAFFDIFFYQSHFCTG